MSNVIVHVTIVAHLCEQQPEGDGDLGRQAPELMATGEQWKRSVCAIKQERRMQPGGSVCAAG